MISKKIELMRQFDMLLKNIELTLIKRILHIKNVVILSLVCLMTLKYGIYLGIVMHDQQPVLEIIFIHTYENSEIMVNYIAHD